VNNASDERGIGTAARERIANIRCRSRSARRDHGNRHRIGNRARERQVVPGTRTVTIHTRHQELARTQLCALNRPLHRVECSWHTAAGNHYAPTYGDIQTYRAQLARQQTYLGDRGGRPLFGNLGVFTTLFLANNTYYRNDMFKNTRYITSGRTYQGRRYVESYRGGSSSGSRFGGGK
jgi:hypothetical protein